MHVWRRKLCHKAHPPPTFYSLISVPSCRQILEPILHRHHVCCNCLAVAVTTAIATTTTDYYYYYYYYYYYFFFYFYFYFCFFFFLRSLLADPCLGRGHVQGRREDRDVDELRVGAGRLESLAGARAAPVDDINPASPNAM